MIRSFNPFTRNNLFEEKMRKLYRSHSNTVSFATGCPSRNDLSGNFLKTKRLLVSLILCLPLLSYTNIISAQDINDRGFVVYADNARDASYTQSANRPMISRTAKSEQGQIFSRQKKIIATYDDNYFMTEGVKHCLKIAMNTWEEKLDIKVPIKFFVCISEDLDPEIEIATTVSYIRKSQQESQPGNLYYQTSASGNDTHDTIKINACIDWNSSWAYDGTSSGNVSMSRAFLRHIAHILGFGSSVTKRENRLETAIPQAISPFDRLLTDGNCFLSNINYMSSSELEAFFSKPLHLKSSSFSYNIYGTAGYVPLLSGNYFSLGHDNIMEYPQTDDKRLLPINRETLDVMAAIGWNVKPYDVEITSAGTDVLGYGSVYDNLSFTAQRAATQESAGQAVWIYQAYNKDKGGYENIANHSGTSFTITPDLSLGSLDEFGCIEARVIYRVSETDYTLPLSLETRPLIGNVIISNVSFPDSQHYKFDLSIQQKGASKGTILVSDDTGTVLQYKFTGDVIHVGPLVVGGQAYIDISLDNAYGTASKFLQEEVYIASGLATNSNGPAGLEIRLLRNKGIEIQSNHPINALVYDINGMLVAYAKAITSHTIELKAGCYMLTLEDKKRNKTMTRKFLLK